MRGELEERSQNPEEERKERPSDVPLDNLAGRANYAINEDDDRYTEPLIGRATENRNSAAGEAGPSAVKIGYMAGTIQRVEQERLKKLIYRATRGNALVHFR